MSYQSMPPAPPPQQPYGQPQQRGPAPSTVVNAVRLMFLLAALGVVGLIIAFTDKNALRDAVREKNPDFDSSKLDSTVNTAITVGAVIGIVLIVLFVLLALQVRKGRNWARIVTWVITGLGVLGALGNLVQTQAALTKVIAVIDLVVYVAVIILLALRPSNDYFRKPRLY